MSAEEGVSFSISVAVVPSNEAKAAIETLRTALAVAEPASSVVKLLNPFYTPQLFAQKGILEELASFCSRRRPYLFRLDTTEIFEHGKKGFTLQLIPSTITMSHLKEHRQHLLATYPRCVNKHPSKPHLTLAHFGTREAAEKAQVLIKNALTPIEWPVSQLHIVEDEALDDPLSSKGQSTKILHSFPFSAASITPAPSIIGNQNAFTPTDVFRFREGKWLPIDAAKEPAVAPSTLVVVSWNVLYHLHQADKLFTTDRIPHILRELEATNADIITLQEVTVDFLAALVAAGFVQQHYFVSDHTGGTVRPYGQLILSKFPFTASVFLFSPQKKLTLGSFTLHDRRLVMPVLHLTSNLAKQAQAQRQAQMQVVFSAIPADVDSIIIGDFNTESDEEAATLVPAEWTDCWSTLRPDEIGNTFDPFVNTTANITSQSKLQRRYDRCLARTAHLRPTNIEMFATSSITWTEAASEGAKKHVLFPSDHYGLRVTFKWEDAPLYPMLDPLYSALAPHQPFECAAGVHLMTNLPARIAVFLQHCVPPPLVVQPSGGLRLGVYSSGSDADLVCFGRLPPKEFFEVAKKALLSPETGVSCLRLITEAFVPLLSFRWQQVEVDLEYCHVPAPVDLTRAVSLVTNEIAKQMDEKSIRCLSGCRDWDTLLAAVPNVPLFRLLVTAVKLWAKRRGIYGARLGFLGGFSYTVLAAKVAQANPRATSRELLCEFFATYGKWDWSKPVSVAMPDAPSFTPEARDQMIILTLSRPVRNSARHVVHSTRHIIALEFARAAAICKSSQESNLTALLDELVQPAPFFKQHQFYVQIIVSALGKKEFVAFSGYVEGKFPVLLLRVEEARFIGFPYDRATHNTESSFPFSSSYWIGLDCNQMDAQNITAGISDVLATFRKTEAMDILARLRTAVEAEAIANSSTQGRAKQTDDDDADDEEEENEEEEEVDNTVPELDSKKPAAAPGTNHKGRWAPHKQKKYKRVDVDSLDAGGAEAVPKTEKMRTGIEAYNRIKWDESIDVNHVMIGFEDRFLGVVECPWNDFDVENVPLHRLRYFKHRGVVIYDRIHRIDTLFQHRKSKP